MSTLRYLLDRKDGDLRCGLPPGFFRLRYFYGKQLLLADYVDEQRYHAGKMRFHNERLHGAGILCGLRVTLLDPSDVMLRVGRGAALDDCGREIIIGFDQCVDVDAWYRHQKRVLPPDDDRCHPDKENRVRICVVIRYSECAQAPEPAPRNPCAAPSNCSCGGCGCSSCRGGVQACPDPCGDNAEFGRVTEEFELKLMFHDDAKRATEHELFPREEEIEDAVKRASGGIGLLSALAEPIRLRCPARGGEWLMLACFSAVIEGEGENGKVAKIKDIDYDCASQVLLSTEVIQHLLADLYSEVDPNIGGPEISRIDLRKLGGAGKGKDAYERYQFILHLTGPIDPDSLDESANFNLRKLVKGAGWDLPENNVIRAEYSDRAYRDFIVEGPAIYLTINNAAGYLAEGERYHLFTPRDANPVVDGWLRHLRPRDLSWRFGLAADANTGELKLTSLSQEVAA